VTPDAANISVVYLLCAHDIPSHRAYEFVDAIFANVAPERFVLLNATHFPAFSSFCLRVSFRSVIVLGSILASQYVPMTQGATEHLQHGERPVQAPMLRSLVTGPSGVAAECEPLESSNFTDGVAAAALTHVRPKQIKSVPLVRT
jgi:hypothetical protein